MENYTLEQRNHFRVNNKTDIWKSHIGKRVQKLSGGQRQRIAIVRTI